MNLPAQQTSTNKPIRLNYRNEIMNSPQFKTSHSLLFSAFRLTARGVVNAKVILACGGALVTGLAVTASPSFDRELPGEREFVAIFGVTRFEFAGGFQLRDGFRVAVEAHQ